MPGRLKFLTARPARVERFAGAPRNFAGRPEEDGRAFRNPDRCPIEGRSAARVGDGGYNKDPITAQGITEPEPRQELIVVVIR